jgi:tetratricopeptide (TPR) repeat protein
MAKGIGAGGFAMRARHLSAVLVIVFTGVFIASPASAQITDNKATKSAPTLSAEEARDLMHKCVFPVANMDLDREAIESILAACTTLINSEGGSDDARSMVHLQRGSMYRRLGKFELALADFTMSIQYDPKSADAYTGRGNAYRGLHKFDEAIADHSEVIKLQPKNASAYNNRGNVWRDKDDNQRAIADYNAAIKLDPHYAIAFFNRALARLDADDKEGGVADLRQALKLRPAFRQAADMLKQVGANP